MTRPHGSSVDVGAVARADTPAALRVLLANAIDYAGLFPPARLDMPGAVDAYASYLDSDDAWALGRFVVPAARLDELASVATALVTERDAARSVRGGEPWRLSVLSGADIPSDMRLVRTFDSRFAGTTAGQWRARVEAVEVRAPTVAAVAEAVAAVDRHLECYVEIPISDDPEPLVRAIAAVRARAKVRTGGTTAEAFPSRDDLLRFLSACVRAHVPFKATAGLHHPLRGTYPLTYESRSAHGTMFGFLNVFLAAAFLLAGKRESVARDVLEAEVADRVTFDHDGAEWRGQRLTRAELDAARRLSITSFGSCSFREPLDDLASLRMR